MKALTMQLLDFMVGRWQPRSLRSATHPTRIWIYDQFVACRAVLFSFVHAYCAVVLVSVKVHELRHIGHTQFGLLGFWKAGGLAELVGNE